MGVILLLTKPKLRYICFRLSSGFVQPVEAVIVFCCCRKQIHSKKCSHALIC